MTINTCHITELCDTGSIANIQSDSDKMIIPPNATSNSPLVCAIAYDGLCTFEFGIATELFALLRPEIDHWYRFATVKAEPGPIRATGGITIDAEDDLSLLNEASLIFIPGWRVADESVPDALCEALIKAHSNGARIASICAGVFVLAEAGLLDGGKATTHWRLAEKLAQKYPNVTVDPDVLFVEHGRVYTSAGSAAGLDLGLHLIRNDFGAQVAASVARRLVVPAQRGGGQRQFIPRPVPKARPGSGLAPLLDSIRGTLDEPWPIERMASVTATSPRTLIRNFNEEVGTTPLKWLTAERVVRATELIENREIPLTDIWVTCGFGSAETFRREFRKTIGVPPTRYRETLGAI
jgi:AraC family transcriptional activator FtrA